MTINEFRKKVRTAYPHAKISVRTVSFQDLARASRKCLTADNLRSADELAQINAWAEETGIIRDTSIRSYPVPKQEIVSCPPDPYRLMMALSRLRPAESE